MSRYTKNFDEFSLDEKWNLDKGEGVKSTGEFHKKTVTELKKTRASLKKKKDRTAEDTKKLRKVNFAIRAKTGFGKIKEEAITLADEAATEVWKDKLQNVYEDLEDLTSYEGLAEGLGFENAEAAWEANPTIQGSTNPAEYKTVKEEYEMDLESGDMGDEHAKAVLARAIDNSKALDNVQLKAAFDEICKDSDVPEGTPELIKESLMNLLKDLAQQAKDLSVG